MTTDALTETDVVRHTEYVMGTAFTFDVCLEDQRQADDASTALERACQWLRWVDRTFTTYDPHSYVSRLGRSDVALSDCPSEVALIVSQCERYRDVTNGWFDPWSGPGGLFDPSGLVKGWSAQRASQMLRESGFARHCVNAGGDVVVSGEGPTGAPSWGVGIVHPLVPRAFCAVVSVRDEGVATSGTGERGPHVWGRDGRPSTDLASVTVIANDLARADALATAALAMGYRGIEWLHELGVDGYAVDARGGEWSTPGFQRRRTWPLPEIGPTATAI